MPQNFPSRVVDWADEEGARFGKSLFGSAACSGSLDLDEARRLVDKQGVRLPDALLEAGIDLERVKESGRELGTAAAYLELHIEQGPVLLDLGLPLGAVLGTFGVERHALTFRGQGAHSGSTPMNRRRDAFLAAAKMGQEIYGMAARSHGGVCTIGSCTTRPGIATSVVEECRITLDCRHLDPAPFHPELVAFADACIREICGTSHRLPSGPLHDAAEMAMAGVPTAMLFVQSLHGISHNKIEDTRREHLELAVHALDRLATKTMDWVAART